MLSTTEGIKPLFNLGLMWLESVGMMSNELHDEMISNKGVGGYCPGAVSGDDGMVIGVQFLLS